MSNTLKVLRPFKPPPLFCTNCKYSFIVKSGNSGNSERQLCKLFSYSFSSESLNKIEYVDTLVCRSQSHLCGLEAMYYNPR
jgi:hypothetical protein